MRVALRLLLLFLTLMVPVVSEAQQGGPGMYRGMPYGQFCPGPRSRPYGAPKAVGTVGDARQLIESYFTGCGQRLRCGKIEEKTGYFEADMLNREGVVVDKVIVDKRTGRIRSIY